MPGFQIDALVPVHNRKGFSYGSEPLDRHFQTLVTQDIKRRLCNCFVALDDTGEIAGFYTFSASSLPMSELSVQEAKRLPRYPSLPAGSLEGWQLTNAFRAEGWDHRWWWMLLHERKAPRQRFLHW